MRGAVLFLVATLITADIADPSVVSADSNEPSPPPLTLGAYVETYWQWNFGRPSNDVTNYRAFDNRHNSFTLSNLALDVQWDVEDVVGRTALQVGHTPSTYYASEPTSEATTGANGSGAELWKYVQQANVGYRLHIGARTLVLQAGIFLSPIGPESMVVHENWHWSRSNLFFGLPFYHTGARAVLSASPVWTLSLAVFNGWNSVVDNNENKSVAVQATYAPSGALTLGLLYFAGVERTKGAAEGENFRHLFDTHVTYQVASWLALMSEANAGYEPTTRGASAWAAGALSLRVPIRPNLALATRGDVLYERVPSDEGGRAGPLFFPARWVSSATTTLAFQPVSRISVRLEYRHDHAASAMYYRGEPAAGDAADARKQDTLTLGVTAWY